MLRLLKILAFVTAATALFGCASSVMTDTRQSGPIIYSPSPTVGGTGQMIQLPQGRATPPPRPGFGEPLSAGPYLFFPDHRKDWAEIVDSAGEKAGLLPHLTWQLCYIPSLDTSKRRADRTQAEADLRGMLERVGIANFKLVKPNDCKIEPRELDLIHLSPVVPATAANYP